VRPDDWDCPLGAHTHVEGRHHVVTHALAEPAGCVVTAAGWEGECLMATTADTGTQVLTFRLGEKTCCVDITYVAEIVRAGELTTTPSDAAHVAGMMDLRGQTTTIVDLSALLDRSNAVSADGGRSNGRIVVLDSDTVGTEGATGWLVSDVHEVTEVTEETLDTDSVGDTDLLRGLITDDEGFTLWLNPREFTT
jgi:purine-binding chemotaxis protein CheW